MVWYTFLIFLGLRKSNIHLNLLKLETKLEVQVLELDVDNRAFSTRT